MSNLPKNSAASGMIYGIVVGGHDADPAPDQSGGLRVYFPGLHGKDVKTEHLNFSPRIMSPTKGTQQEFTGGLDPGTLVVALKDTGSNYCQILGIAADNNRAEDSIPGNTNLMQFVNRFLDQNIKVQLPPQIYETNDNGVRVRRIREKGFHNHNALKGLPTHGALYNLSGAPVPRVLGVSTSKQSFDGLLTGGILNQLPGIVMTLGSMFGLLQSSGLLNNVLKNVPREIGTAIRSMSNLIQTIETTERAGFTVGSRVHQQTFLGNAVNLLSQSKTISDVVNSLGRLQTDSSLSGAAQLANVVINLTSFFGKSQLSISPSGSIRRIIPKETQTAIDLFFKIFAIFMGAYPGQRLFGDSADQIFKMANRLTPKSFALEMLQLKKLNESPQALRFDSVNRTTTMGGNPFLVF